MKNKPPLDKRGESRSDAQPSLKREMSGVAPTDTDAFSRRAGEIIAKTVGPSAEKPKQRRNK
jgi:hypothetical protein